MNRFLKINLLWFSLLGLALVVVIMAYIFRPKSIDYQTDILHTLQLMQNKTRQVTAQGLAGKQIIDIRSAELFEQRHPLQAINIPIRQLLKKESLEWLKELQNSGKEVVLCGQSELQASAPWLLLQQLGYKNILLFKGGISSTGDLIGTDLVSSETSVVDTVALHTSTTGKTPAEMTVEKKNHETVIPTRKANSTGGGC